MHDTFNRTVVRGWTSAANAEREGKGVGHVSIELFGSGGGYRYISLFPKGMSILRAITHTIPHEYRTLAEDNEVEKRPAEFLFCFYTFDHDAMLARADRIESNIKGWSVVGNLTQMEAFWRTESCVSLSYKILKSGDDELIMPTIVEQTKGSVRRASWLFRSPSYCSEVSCAALVLSPDAFVNSLKEMKLKELQKRPELSALTYDGETDLSVVVQPARSLCSVM